MNKKSETDVVKIRVTPSTKKNIEKLARLEGRTFASQCRMILDCWCKGEIDQSKSCITDCSVKRQTSMQS